MANNYFQFKQFVIHQDRCAMKVSTDACLFGAWVASDMQNMERASTKILDIGTGTGLISLMTAQKNVGNFDAVEIDIEIAAQAKENAAASPWKDNIRIFTGDIKSFYPSECYDVIISNPPFYENELSSTGVKKNIAHHSAELTINEVLDSIKNLLKKDGRFYLLLPFKRWNEIEKLLEVHHLYIQQKITVKPSHRHPPFRVMVRGGFKKQLLQDLELSIKDDDDNYTMQFTQLLKDYYLYL